MSYLSLIEFKTRAKINGQDQDAFLGWFLDSISDTIDKHTGNIFGATPNAVKRYTSKTQVTRFLSVGAWQETGLVVKYFDNAQATAKVLVKDVDFEFVYPDSLVNPIIGIKLINYSVFNQAYLQLEGNFGYYVTAKLSPELDVLIYKMALVAYGANTNQLQGKIISDRTKDQSITYAQNIELEKYTDSITSGDFICVPAFANAIVMIKILTQPTFTFI